MGLAVVFLVLAESLGRRLRARVLQDDGLSGWLQVKEMQGML